MVFQGFMYQCIQVTQHHTCTQITAVYFLFNTLPLSLLVQRHNESLTWREIIAPTVLDDNFYKKHEYMAYNWIRIISVVAKTETKKHIHKEGRNRQSVTLRITLYVQSKGRFPYVSLNHVFKVGRTSPSLSHTHTNILSDMMWWWATVSWHGTVHQFPQRTLTPAASFSWDQPSCPKPSAGVSS